MVSTGMLSRSVTAPRVEPGAPHTAHTPGTLPAMIKIWAGAVAATALLAVGGCAGDAPEPAPTAADNTAVCAQWKEAQLPYLLHTAPEAKARARAIADSYQGKEPADAVEIQHAYFAAWADATRPLLAQAGSP